MSRLSFGAPGRAHSLGGASPLQARHGEVLAGKGFAGDCESEGRFVVLLQQEKCGRPKR
jgi:hypothetical protein